MLPKIRKTNAGSAPPLARPSIRPVAARKPPPPPAPPRKFPSGITPRSERTYDEDGDPATMMGFADPPTMSAPHAVPQAAPHRAPLVSFDEETQMRPVDDGLLAQSREDETWARVDARIDAHVHTQGAPSEAPSTVPHFPEPAHAHARAHAHDIYEALPSLEVRRPFDTYEAEFAERDPATQLHAARHLHEQAPATHREDSGARERPRKYAAPVPVYDDSVDSYRPEPEPRVELSEPAIPRAAPVPSVPDGFIVGVQPIRTPPGGALFPAHDAFAHHAPQHPMPPATAAASPHAMHAAPYAHPHPYPQQQQQQQYPAYTANAYTSGPRPALVATHPPAPPPMQPVGHQIQTLPPPPSSSRTLRFAWFVFGVAFGIGFTFFASGVVPGVKKDEPAATFPPAPAVPTQVAQPVQAPPPPVAPLATAATVAPPQPAPAPLAAPPVLATAEPAPAPAPPPVVQAKAAPPPAAKVAAAPRTPPRRPAPPPQSAAPKALPNSGSVDSDSVASDTSSSSSSAASKPAATASAEIPKDLFGAALNP